MAPTARLDLMPRALSNWTHPPASRRVFLRTAPTVGSRGCDTLTSGAYRILKPQRRARRHHAQSPPLQKSGLNAPTRRKIAMGTTRLAVAAQPKHSAYTAWRRKNVQSYSSAADNSAG